MTITKAQLLDMVCDLKARLDALEGRRVEASAPRIYAANPARRQGRRKGYAA